MSLESQILKALKIMSVKEGIEIEDPTIILVDKAPTEALGIDFEKATIEFNPKCQKQPVFKKMIKKGGLDRFLEYSVVFEILKYKTKDKQKASLEVMRRYPEYLDMIGAAMGHSKRQLRLAQKRAEKVGCWGG